MIGVLLAVPVGAGADLPAPGANGEIVFTSGRDVTGATIDNTNAQLWLVDTFGQPGTATRLTSSIFNTSHHRHASWSPDHTKLALARGPDNNGFSGPWDIWIQDLVLGSGSAIASQSSVQDRPAFSPDGTKVAYARDLDDAAGTANWVIETRNANGTGLTTIATGVDTMPSSQFARPHWSPDGEVIYYAKLDTVTPTDDHDIFRAPADGSNTTGTVVVNGGADDYQPMVSPAGDRICFTRQDGADKDVVTTNTAGGALDTVASTTGQAYYECAWSPDTEQMLFTRGGFGDGALMINSSDGSAGISFVADVANPAFDGNGDWAQDLPPECQDGTATVLQNGSARISLSCADPELDDPDLIEREIVTAPPNGSLGAIEDDGDVVYTPKQGFSGSDSFSFRGSDGLSDSNTATVNITVNPLPPTGSAADPELRGLVVSPKRFRRGGALPQLAAAVGTTIAFNLSEDASTRLAFSRARPGRRSGGKCRKPTRGNRGKPKCTRYVRAGSLSVDGKSGDNSLRFQGRLSSRKRLKLGKHRVTVSATDADGNGSNRLTASFRIVRR